MPAPPPESEVAIDTDRDGIRARVGRPYNRTSYGGRAPLTITPRAAERLRADSDFTRRS